MVSSGAYKVGDDASCGTCGDACVITDLKNVDGTAVFELGCGHYKLYCPDCDELVNDLDRHICASHEDADLLDIIPKPPSKAYEVSGSSGPFKENLLRALRSEVTIAYMDPSPEKHAHALTLEKLVYRIESGEFDNK